MKSRKTEGSESKISRLDQSRLRVGLIVDSTDVSAYVYDLCEWAKMHPALEITHLIVQVKPSDPASQSRPAVQRALDSVRKRGLGHVLRHRAFKAIELFEKRLLRRVPSATSHFESYDAAAIVPAKIEITPLVSPSGFVHRFSAADINAVRAGNFDVLIRCGSGILRGEILSAAKHGVLSFHHADNRINRGSPPGFWEVYHRQESTGFVIQRLTEELDGGNVLFRGHFPTRYYYLANQAQLFLKANVYMKKLLSDLAETQRLPDAEANVPYFNQLFRQPGLLQQARYFTQLVSRIVQTAISKRITKRAHRWSVGYAKSDW